MAAPNINTDYYNTQQYKNSQTYQNQTINDLGKKYGFDFSKDYANKQAETIALGQRNAQQAAQRQNDSSNQLNMQRILDDYNGAASSLDKGYFQQFLGQGQNQVNRGINGGLAADQNLRLAMNKQGELADVWRTRNQANQEESMRFSNTNQTILDALAQIEKEKGMNGEKMYQDGLYKGYDILGQDRNYGLQLDNSVWSRYQDLFGNDLERQKFEWQKQQAAKAGSGGGGGRVTTPVIPKSTATSLSNASNAYNMALKSQSQSNIEKYASNPAMIAGQRTGSPYFSNPVSVADNKNLSAYDKMKMLGL